MKILIIEDDTVIAQSIKKGLEDENFTVEHYTDGLTGLAALLNNNYQAVILDLMLPGRDGISILNRARQEGVETPILILSAKQSVDDRIRGISQGSDDYMTKPFSFAELLVRIQALIRREEKHKKSQIIRLADLTVDPARRQVERSGTPIELPNKEYELLLYLLHNRGTTIAKSTILKEIYGYNFDPQTNVVDVLVCRLRHKLDKEFNPKLLHTIRGIGYVLRSE